MGDRLEAQTVRAEVKKGHYRQMGWRTGFRTVRNCSAGRSCVFLPGRGLMCMRFRYLFVGVSVVLDLGTGKWHCG